MLQDCDVDSLPTMRWTPAEATQIFLNNMHDPVKGIRDLVDLQPASITT